MGLSRCDFESWGCMIIWRAFNNRSHLGIWSNILEIKCTVDKLGLFFWFAEFRQGKRSFDNEQRCSTPASFTVANIEAAEKKKKRAGPRVAAWEIQESLSIRTAATVSILNNRLRVNNRCAGLIHDSLTEKQLRVRVEWCKFRLRKVNGGRSELTWEVLTDEKTGICWYNMKTKM